MEKKDGIKTCKKKPLLFISHSSNDKPFVEELVKMFERIGFNGHNMFCSSVAGYGISVNSDIFEKLRSLFDEYDLYVVFVLSPNFYNSPVCLNEMGAAWVLKTDYTCILTCDMDYSNIKGVVPNCNIYTKGILDNDNKGRLNELKDELVNFFGLQPLGKDIIWENIRDDFLKKVSTIRSESKVDCASKNTLKNANDSAALNKNIDLLSDEERIVLNMIKGKLDRLDISDKAHIKCVAVDSIINKLISKGFVSVVKDGSSIKYTVLE